jgi:hypothetical protein
MRVGNILICNQPFMFGVIFKIIRLFMKEKMRQRVVMIGSDVGKLAEYVTALFSFSRHSLSCHRLCVRRDQSKPTIRIVYTYV